LVFMASLTKSPMASLVLIFLLALAFADEATADAMVTGRKLLNRPIFGKSIQTPCGTLEVLLIEGKNLKNTDFIGKMNTYVLIQYGTQQQQSKVSQGTGGTVKWNESFKFNLEYPAGPKDQHKITFKIMDKDRFTKDDFVGEAVVYAKDVVSLGLEKGEAHLEPAKYRVVLANKNYYGEIKTGVTFIKKP
ncbi:hypothetical protein, partial [Ralstonia pseudosolanacearum]|uniref:hypothetical protein n=1 Tax=Ralstonia pseudosolanacearum TaxID=1310165 RepID=UPI003CF21035